MSWWEGMLDRILSRHKLPGTRTNWIIIRTVDLFTCVRPLVNLQVLRPREESVAAGEGTHEGLLPGVDPDVVDEFVFCFEGLSLPGALPPVTGVVRVLRASDVVHSQVVDDIVHGVEHLVAHLPGVGVLPLTHCVHFGGGLVLHVAVVGAHVCSVVTTVVWRGHEGVRGCCCSRVEAGAEHGVVWWGGDRGHGGEVGGGVAGARVARVGGAREGGLHLEAGGWVLRHVLAHPHHAVFSLPRSSHDWALRWLRPVTGHLWSATFVSPGPGSQWSQYHQAGGRGRVSRDDILY